MTIRRSSLAILFVMMLVLVAGFAPRNVQAQDDSSALARTIRVTGFGAASGAPDVAYMDIGVESADSDIAAALEDNNARMEAILSALSEFGIASENVRTLYFNIYQDKGFPPDMPIEPGAEPDTMYRISNVVNITIRDTSQVGDILSAVIESGANVVHGVNFDIADRGALEADARIAALDDSRDRAQQLADQLGVELGVVISVTELSGGFYSPVASYGGGGGGIPPIAEGSLGVNIALEVTFAIQ